MRGLISGREPWSCDIQGGPKK